MRIKQMSSREEYTDRARYTCHTCGNVDENNVSDACYCTILGKWYIYGGYGSTVIDNDTLEVRHPSDLKLDPHPENEEQNPHFCDNCLKHFLVRNIARFVIEGGHWCGDEEWKDEYYLVRFHVWKEMKEDGSLFYGQNIKDLKIRKFDREAYLAERKRIDEVMEKILSANEEDPALRRFLEIQLSMDKKAVQVTESTLASDSVLAKEDEARHKAEKLIEKIDTVLEQKDETSIKSALQEAVTVIQELSTVIPHDFALLASLKTVIAAVSSHKDESFQDQNLTQEEKDATSLAMNFHTCVQKGGLESVIPN